MWRVDSISLKPLLEAPLAIQIHAFAALSAFLLGVVQLARVKGTRTHRALGYTWVGLMVFVAASSMLIHELRQWGNFSLIHLLSVFTLAMLPLGIYFARRHNVVGHRKTMLGLFFGALVIAGAFTLLPSRILGRIMFGG
ncbi:MAG TPA: DUF2306 domain-containing protein [Hyphomicrobiaceae bacterium]|nr:DUF2306 domain-containing protein [Hyphomicrobiaceae bacterium]